MAVYAAHLTRTLQGTPSVFQVIAQEALGETVKPALQRVVEYLAAVYPDKCGWCARWYDELYLLFDCCLQYHYLKHYAATFSESFYGLLRVPTQLDSEFSSGQRLPAHLERASLVLQLLVPYVRDKASVTVQRWREDVEEGKSDRLRKAAVKVYSTVHLVCCGARLVQLARYAAGRTPEPSPALAALGLALRPAPPPHDDTASWGDLVSNLLTGHIGSAAPTFPMVGSALLSAAQYGAFGVQLLRWWGARAPAAAALPAPPPQRDERSERWKNKCPICLQTWKIPTVLPVSGYVFCYVCITRHVREAGRCPLSGWPAAQGSLLRLYC